MATTPIGFSCVLNDNQIQMLAMAMRGVLIFTTLISFLLMHPTALANDRSSYLARGSSVSTQDDTTTILVSPNGAFRCGFYKVATNAFTFSIWYSQSAGKTVAWTANRDAPVNGKGSRPPVPAAHTFSTVATSSSRIQTVIPSGGASTRQPTRFCRCSR